MGSSCRTRACVFAVRQLPVRPETKSIRRKAVQMDASEDRGVLLGHAVAGISSIGGRKSKQPVLGTPRTVQKRYRPRAIRWRRRRTRIAAWGVCVGFSAGTSPHARNAAPGRDNRRRDRCYSLPRKRQSGRSDHRTTPKPLQSNVTPTCAENRWLSEVFSSPSRRNRISNHSIMNFYGQHMKNIYLTY